MPDNTVEIELNLGDARSALSDFEDEETAKRHVQRLQADAPMHPLLVAGRAGSAVGVGLAAMVLAWVAAVALGVPMPDQLMLLADPTSAAPAPLVGIALSACSAVFSGCAYGLAAMVGEQRPMLEHERQRHQGLVSDVLRLEAQRSVRRRIVFTPSRN